MIVDIEYKPGTQKSPQQTKISQPCFTDTDHIHFPDGKLSTIPPYTDVGNSYGSVELLGAVRAIHGVQLTGTYVGTYTFFASNTRLMVRKNGILYNITPISSSSTALINNPYYTGYDNAQTTPFGTTNGSTIVTFLTFVAGFLRVGDMVTITGVGSAVNGVPAAELNGTHRVISFSGGNPQFQVTTAANASGFPSVGGVVISAKLVVISHTAHGFVDGDRVKISGASGTVGGIPASEVNGEHIINVGDADFYAFSTSTAPTSYATGGGASVLEFGTIAAGNLDQGAAVGVGAGIVGQGIVGQGGPPVAAQTFPRIWSIANFGNEVVMCPGDYSTGDGQKIYIWDGDLSTAPTVLTNAPTDCNWVLVVNNSVVALCGRTVKISEQGDGTVWSGQTTYTKTLERVWKLVSGFVHGEKDAVIYTPNEAILLRYVGGGDLWDLSDLYTEDGILSPYSATLLNTVLRWRGNRGSYSYDGGPVRKEYNDQNEDWLVANINYGKSWKSFAMSDAVNNQWWHFFPAGTDSEPNDYAIYHEAGHVTLGQMARTAAQRPGFVDSAYYMANATSESVEGTIYRHFTNGAVTFDWFAQSSLAFAEPGYRFMVNQVIPDSNQSGSCELRVVTREFSQSPDNITAPYEFTASTPWITTKAAGQLIGWELSGSTALTMGAWKASLKKLGKALNAL